MLKPTQVEGERGFLAALDPAFVARDLVDDRFVPPDAQASNARLVRETLLQGPAAMATFWPLIEARDTDAGGVASSAATGTDQTASASRRASDPDLAPVSASGAAT